MAASARTMRLPAGHFADDGNFSGGGVEREEVMRGEADHARAAGQRDGVDDGLAGDALAEVPRGLWLHAPFLDPILNQFDVRDGDGAAARRAAGGRIDEGDGAGPGAGGFARVVGIFVARLADFEAADGDGGLRVGDGAGVEDDAGEAVEGGGEDVRFAGGGGGARRRRRCGRRS